MDDLTARGESRATDRAAMGPGTAGPGPWVPRSILVAGGVVAALVVIAVVVVLIRPTGPTSYPDGSPEAAFQAYMSAYDTEDVEGAYDWFSSSVRESLSIAEYRRLLSENSWQQEQSRRIVLDRVDLGEQRAILHLRVEQFSQDGLGGSRWSYDLSVRLVTEQGTWRIDEPLLGVEPGHFGH